MYILKNGDIQEKDCVNLIFPIKAQVTVLVLNLLFALKINIFGKQKTIMLLKYFTFGTVKKWVN